ncbi:MAG: hypothetical protein M1812_007120 [Candelaria pacifica]|nr:MAG: hypothetical protein M1812_007120 [Candelaria pacifica]
MASTTNGSNGHHLEPNGHSPNKTARPATDPSIYSTHIDRFNSSKQPQGADAWIERAREVAAILAGDAAQRDIENKSPRAEIELLKASGLLKVKGQAEFGGGAQGWDVGYRVIREVAKGDGSIVVGTDEQKTRIQELIFSNNYFVGGAVNPRDDDLSITSDGDDLVFNGFKNFNTGGVISDLTILEGVYEGTENHIFSIIKTDQPGVTFAHNWDNIGLRLTESGGVTIKDVRVPWKDAFGWDAIEKKPLETILKVPYATLQLPTNTCLSTDQLQTPHSIQLVFSNFYIGIALGALDFATNYTRTTTRPWPFTSSPAPTASDEFYILSTYGNFHAHLRAAEALADRAGSEIASLYASHSAHRDVTARKRGEVAEWVASTKVVATDTALRVTAGVFEATGARATGRKVGLDRYWRDVRTHTLHDPVAYKNRELGRFVLTDEIPTPSWYT